MLAIGVTSCLICLFQLGINDADKLFRSKADRAAVDKVKRQAVYIRAECFVF